MATCAATCLGVGEAAILQDLEHHVEDVRVGLLDLIKEDHCVRPPPDRLCQLTALVVAHIACPESNVSACIQRVQGRGQGHYPP